MSNAQSLACTVSISELDREPQSFSLVASEADLALVAERFDLISVERLEGSMDVSDAGQGQGIIVRGHIKAAFTQRCIASLQPVKETLDTDFELMLVDPEMADRMDDDGVYLDAEAPDYDALEGEDVPLGEILAQTLSISMNPYPRAEGAELAAGKNTAVTVNEPELERPNPFAVLAKSRDES